MIYPPGQNRASQPFGEKAGQQWIMGLLARYPLNGDSKDLLGGPAFWASPVFSDSLGKMGRCIQEKTGSRTFSELTGKKIFSVSIWYRVLSATSIQYGNVMAAEFSDASSVKGYVRFDNGNATDNAGHAMLYHDNSSAHFAPTLESGSPVFNDHAISFDEWHNAAMTSDGSKLRLYGDGTLYQTSVIADGVALTGYMFSDPNPNALVEDLRIYDSCLSPEEIKNISLAEMAHWEFDDPYCRKSGNMASTQNVATISWNNQSLSDDGYEDVSGMPFAKARKATVTVASSGDAGGSCFIYDGGNISVSGSKTYTASLYVRASDDFAGVIANSMEAFLLHWQETDSSGTFLGGGNEYSSARDELLQDGWHRIYGTLTTAATAANLNSFGAYIYMKAGAVATYEVGGIQLEEGSALSPYSYGFSDTYDTVQYKRILDLSGMQYDDVPLLSAYKNIVFDSDAKRYVKELDGSDETGEKLGEMFAWNDVANGWSGEDISIFQGIKAPSSGLTIWGKIKIPSSGMSSEAAVLAMNDPKGTISTNLPTGDLNSSSVRIKSSSQGTLSPTGSWQNIDTVAGGTIGLTGGASANYLTGTVGDRWAVLTKYDSAYPFSYASMQSESYDATANSQVTNISGSDRYSADYVNCFVYDYAGVAGDQFSLADELGAAYVSGMTIKPICKMLINLTSLGMGSLTAKQAFDAFAPNLEALAGGTASRVFIPGGHYFLQGGYSGVYSGKAWHSVAVSAKNGEWADYAMVYDGKDLKSYTNGELTSTAAVSSTALPIEYDCMPSIQSIALFMGLWYANGEKATFSVASLRMFSSALSAEEIKKLSDEPADVSSDGSLIADGIEEYPWCEEVLSCKLAGSYYVHQNGFLQSDGTYYCQSKNFLTNPNESWDECLIPVDTSKFDYYYRFRFDAEGTNNWFLIGFSLFDSVKTATPNNSCSYVVNIHSNGAFNQVVQGSMASILGKTLSSGNPVKYFSLRILNDWASSTHVSGNNCRIYEAEVFKVPKGTVPPAFVSKGLGVTAGCAVESSGSSAEADWLGSVRASSIDA